MKKCDFIEYIKPIAKENKIKLRFSDSMYVRYGVGKSSKSLGYFDSNKTKDYNGVLACAMKNPLSFNVLVHESCHLDQYIENTKLWRDADNYLSVFFDWVDGKEIHHKKLKKAFIISQQLELDCERRAVKKIKKLNLDIDVERYIQEANAYIYLYTYIYMNRVWYKPRKPIYKDNLVLSLMPKKFIKDYTHIPPKILEAYKLRLSGK